MVHLSFCVNLPEDKFIKKITQILYKKLNKSVILTQFVNKLLEFTF